MAILAKTNGCLIIGSVILESDTCKHFQEIHSIQIQKIQNDDENKKLFENVDDALDWIDEKLGIDSSYLKSKDTN